MNKYICKYCGKEYEWINGKSKEFCCTKHIIEWKKENYGKLQTYICSNCGKEYEVDISLGNWNKDNNQIIIKGQNNANLVVKSLRFCCYECGKQNTKNKIKQTNLRRYGVTCSWKCDEVKLKSKQTCLERYGNKNYRNREKAKQTCLNKYGVDNPNKLKEIRDKTKKTNLERYNCNYGLQNKEIQEKSRQTCLRKYGVNRFSETKDFKKLWKNSEFLNKAKEKEYNTKRKNHTFNTSKPEEQIYQLLLQKFNKVERQYKSEFYPFNCDFYIPKLDLYIEYQGFWTHGKEPYNENNKEHKKIIEKWKKCIKNNISKKLKRQYNVAINVWTISDPLKRQIARENNLNWIEFFNITEFLEWYYKEKL